MTSRLRPSTRPRRRLSLGGLGGEDRQTFLVNAAFAGIIVLLVAILAGIGAWTFYEQNLRPIARVGAVELKPDMTRDRETLLRLRIDRESRRVRQAVVDGELSQSAAELRYQELNGQLNEVAVQAIEGLIDLIYQSQLAAERGIVVGEADVDARAAEELASPQQRRVLAIFVAPEAADADIGPTYSERTAARQRAEEALAALAAGRPFAEVAAQYSTDPSGQAGGELGVISRVNPVDGAWLDALFELPEGGTTAVVRGQDGTYRIGRVAEILPTHEEQAFVERILQSVSRERYRQFLAWEVAADRLHEQIVEESLGGTPEQQHLAHIRIDNADPTGDDEEDEGEVHYSEILYAPNDDPTAAPQLDESDPAWDAARAEAEQAVAELRAVLDPVLRLERFRGIAREHSDSLISAEDGGDAGFVTRGLIPTDVGDALFDQALEPETLLEPVRADNAYYVLWFHELREPPSVRLERLREALALPDPDFAALASEYSDDDTSKDDGGDIGWWTRLMLEQVEEELAEAVFDLPVGTISEPYELGNSTHIFQVRERGQRALDADQVMFLRSDAFEVWYSERKDEAEASGVIVRADEEADAGLDFGDDELEPGFDEELPDDLPEDETP